MISGNFKRSFVVSLVGVLSILWLLSICLIAAIFFLALWGPPRYSQPALVPVNTLWWGLLISAVAYVISIPVAIIASQVNLSKGLLRRALYMITLPVVFVASGALVFVAINQSYANCEAINCTNRYKPAPTPTYSAVRFAGLNGQLRFNAETGPAVVDFRAGTFTDILSPTITQVSPNGAFAITTEKFLTFTELKSGQSVPLGGTDNAELVRWSVDSKYIAYIVSDYCRLQIGIVEVASRQQKLLKLSGNVHDHGFCIDSAASFGPDNRQLTFSMRSNDQVAVFTVQLSCLDQQPAVCEPIQLTNAKEDSSPDWSPDGSRIIFSHYSNFPHRFALYTMKSDGSDLQQMTQRSPNDAFLDLNPIWSPDGKYIAFTRFTNSISTSIPYGHDVFVVAADGNTEPVQVTFLGGTVISWTNEP